MAIDLTNIAATLHPDGPKSDPIKHVRLSDFPGDGTYPAGGTLGATSILREALRKVPQADIAGLTVSHPRDVGAWIDSSDIYAFFDVDENIGPVKMVFDRAADTLVVKNRADDTEVAPGDRSADRFTLLVLFR